MKMNPFTLAVLLLLAGPLWADPGWHVEYPDSFCVVEGSTATIPCSFTHPAGLRVERVVWCPNHEICHLTTLNVYDSSNVRADSRFRYLGDLVRNCTLKIIKTVQQDAATYHFVLEANAEGYTEHPGVTVRVTNGEDVKVRSSVNDNVVKEGGQVTLTCTSACSFHQLDVHWYRNGQALSEKGPALHLSYLTNDDAGDYTCSLDSSWQKTSAPWSLVVVEDEDGEDVKVRSSVTDNVVKEGGQVTLTCTSNCSFHQLDVHWYRNGHALSETGPALHLSNLTNDDAGDYTCSLDSSGQKTSAPWSLVVVEDEGPLGADPGWHVEYPDSFCVVEGSTATIPCSFTHPAGLRVERVVWCPYSLICHLTVFNVYDSSNVRSDSRFLYLGDRVRNCTLKIIKTVKQDAATYRFLIEANGGGYTGWKGVVVTVINGEDVKVRSSVTDNVVKEGSQVTLTCTSNCSFHQLDVHWSRNGHTLSETGPALNLSSLTNDDTGNYTCSLDSSRQKTSAPWSLVVVEDEEKDRFDWSLTVSVVLKVLLAVFLLLLAGLVFAKRSAPGPEHETVYSEVVH